MIFLISLVLAVMFVRLCAKPLRRHPVPFYLGAAVLSVLVLGCTLGGAVFPGWIRNWVWPIFSRSALATALWAMVMWAGALPAGSKPVKTLMPIRGELSILAGILTLGHNAAYGVTYFRYLFVQPDRLSANQIAAALCSLALIAILLPLFVTSFKTVRRRMRAAAWKRLQRLAYVYYGLLYVHVMLLSIPYALAGRSGYLLNVLVYSVVFLGYGLCRGMKAAAARSHRSESLQRRQLASLASALMASLCLTGALWFAASPEAGQSADAAALSSEQPEQTTEAILDGQTQSPRETEQPPALTGEAQPADDPQPDPEPDEEPSDTPEQAQPQQSDPDQTEASPQPSAAPPEPSASAAVPVTTPSAVASPTPEPSAEPARIYQNGTFTGTGDGFGGPITVSVSIQDDVITAISVVSATEDEPYFTDGKGVISRILSAQSTGVDTISGATFTSGGIISAVKAALSGAKN